MLGCRDAGFRGQNQNRGAQSGSRQEPSVFKTEEGYVSKLGRKGLGGMEECSLGVKVLEA